jgi:hypothetical protein
MPRIIVATDPSETGSEVVLLEERLVASVMESDHYAGQLIERIGWAVRDAEEIAAPDREEVSAAEPARD